MKIFKSPWFWTVLFLFISCFTIFLNRFYIKLDYLSLQLIPDSQLGDGITYNWVDTYSSIVSLLPTIIVFFLSRYIIRRFAKSR